MTKGKKLDEATKNVIRAEVKEAAKTQNGMTKKQIAELHGIHPNMISKIMNEAPAKAAPKRANAKKNSRLQSSGGTDKMEQLRTELKANMARQKEIQREITELFFQRMMEGELTS